MAGITHPPLGVEVWIFNGFKDSVLVYGSWAMRNAQETEAAVYMKLLADGRYDRVQITYEKKKR